MDGILRAEALRMTVGILLCAGFFGLRPQNDKKIKTLRMTLPFIVILNVSEGSLGFQ